MSLGLKSRVIPLIIAGIALFRHVWTWFGLGRGILTVPPQILAQDAVKGMVDLPTVTNLQGNRMVRRLNRGHRMAADRGLRMAIQRQGRLTEGTLALLHAIGLEFESYNQRLLSPCRNFPLELLYARDDDIPEYVATGTVDVGIVGQNMVHEEGADLIELLTLGYGYCSLVLAVPKDAQIDNPRDLAERRVATSYPRSTQAYFARHGIDGVEVIELSGSVEVAPTLGLADAIVDLTATGSALLLNELRPIATILQSQAALMANREVLNDPVKRADVDRLVLRMKAVVVGRRYKYVMMNAPRSALPHIRTILPGLKEPTVVPLTDPEWVAVHAAVQEETFWEVMEALHEAGASEILVAPIEKLVM